MKGDKQEISTLLNIVKSSPNTGTIKVSFNPTDELKVNDEVQVKVTLAGPANSFEEILWIKVKEKEAIPIDVPKETEDFDNIGLPKLEKVKKENWQSLEGRGIPMNRETVMYPEGEGAIRN